MDGLPRASHVCRRQADTMVLGSRRSFNMRQAPFSVDIGFKKLLRTLPLGNASDKTQDNSAMALIEMGSIIFPTLQMQ